MATPITDSTIAKNVEFSHARRGYNMAEVDAYVESVSEGLKQLNEHGQPAVAPTAQVYVADTDGQIEERNANRQAAVNVLEAAEETANKMLTDAASERERLLEEAQTECESLKTQAQTQADALVEEATKETQTLRAQAAKEVEVARAHLVKLKAAVNNLVEAAALAKTKQDEHPHEDIEKSEPVHEEVETDNVAHSDVHIPNSAGTPSVD